MPLIWPFASIGQVLNAVNEFMGFANRSAKNQESLWIPQMVYPVEPVFTSIPGSDVCGAT